MPTARSLYDIAGGQMPPEIAFDPAIAPGSIIQYPILLQNAVTTGVVASDNQVQGVSEAYRTGQSDGLDVMRVLRDNKTLVYATVGVLLALAFTSGRRR